MPSKKARRPLLDVRIPREPPIAENTEPHYGILLENRPWRTPHMSTVAAFRLSRGRRPEKRHRKASGTLLQYLAFWMNFGIGDCAFASRRCSARPLPVTAFAIG